MVILLFVISAAVSLFSLSTLTPMPTPAAPPAPKTAPSVLSLLPCFANTSTESAVILTPATLAVVLPSKSVTLVAFETPAIPAAPKPIVSEEMPCCASASTLNAPALITEAALPSLSVLPTTFAVTSRLTVLVSLPRPTPAPIPATLALPTSPALLV